MEVKFIYTIKKIVGNLQKNIVVIILLVLNIFLVFKINSLTVNNSPVKVYTENHIESMPNVKKYFNTKYSVFVYISKKNCGVCNNLVIDHLKQFKGNSCLFVDDSDGIINEIKKAVSQNIFVFKNGEEFSSKNNYNPIMLLVHNSGKVLIQEYGDITKPEKIALFFEKVNLVIN